MTTDFLEITELSKVYSEPSSGLVNVSISVDKHERFAIVGETGSGKTTLLKLIGGLAQPDSGYVNFQGDRVKGPNELLIAGHKQMGFLSQHFDLPKFISVEEHLNHPDLDEEELVRIYESCQITHLINRDTSALSGGEKQRVALAKLLTNSPELLLLDEPFSNLDQLHKRSMKWMLNQIEKELSISMIMVSHDPVDVLSWATRVVVMKHGQIVQSGTPQEIYENPINEYVAGLFGLYSVIEGKNWKRSGGKLIIRPEQLNSGDKLCTIIRKGYYGSHNLLELLTEDGENVLMTSNDDFEEGEHIRVSLK